MDAFSRPLLDGVTAGEKIAVPASGQHNPRSEIVSCPIVNVVRDQLRYVIPAVMVVAIQPVAKCIDRDPVRVFAELYVRPSLLGFVEPFTVDCQSRNEVTEERNDSAKLGNGQVDDDQ